MKVAVRRPNGYTQLPQYNWRVLSPRIVDEAFSAVTGRFVESARASGCNVSKVHHWKLRSRGFSITRAEPSQPCDYAKQSCVWRHSFHYE